MTDEQIALARSAVACKGWRWMAGMRAEWVGMGTGWRMLSETQSWYEREECEDGEPQGPNAVPDLTDPATLGCLLALVREAWRDDEMHTVRAHDAWNIRHYLGVETGFWFDGDEWYGRTEAEVLVAALEAAP